ncbi:MAG: 2-succinyl-5-enolpyruvyl-6-hydroxy-3-cyclohexene-1-carboxylic-acid synthase [Natronomonas sp.]
MTSPNINTLWGRIIAEELAASGVDSAVLAPGSRSTPLTVAIAEHPDIEALSLLDERSGSFFGLGRAKRTGRPTALVCTSGTALGNFHPAVVEAANARIPLVALTADRPPELQDSGANQTIDQEDFYGDAVRDYRTLPEPEATERKLRSLRVAVCRAVGTARGTNPGPVHLNVPFRKPLEPTVETDEIPPAFLETDSPAVRGRDGPFVDVTDGRPRLSAADRERVADVLAAAESGLIVCGPADPPRQPRESIVDLARATGFPILADPLSGLRFGPHPDEVVVCGGYDSYLEAITEPPEVVVRFGASPTSKVLRNYLADPETRGFVVDPAGGWREASFTATDLLVTDESRFAAELADAIDSPSERPSYTERIGAAETDYWDIVSGAEPAEGAALASIVENAPDPATLFVSNSMPVRDLDRFGRPRDARLTVLGNRGASGIDGITSSGLGAGSGTSDPLVVVLGDLAYYHDSNGLLAVSRCDVDATIVVINNDGGGIFRLLPIEDHDTFDEWFRTPHGLDFEPTAELYGLEFARTDRLDRFEELYVESLESDGTQVLELRVDGEKSHADRERLHQTVVESL